jgi:hypothetical protein
MGKRFLRSIVLPNEDLVASVARAPIDLPVNPLSHLLLRFQITNVAPAASLTYSAIDDLINQITSVTVRHNGENIIQGTLRDLMVLNAVVFGAWPGWSHMSDDDNALRSVVFPLCLGQRMYDGMSCFPATMRGNLQLLITAGADGAAYDDINVSVEAVELIEGAPSEYVKYTSRLQDSVVGQFDVRLPIGNPLLGVLLFDTGLGGASDEVLSWGQIRLLKDNVEQLYATADYEVLAAELHTRMRGMPFLPGHVHQVNAAGAGVEITDDAHTLISTGYQGYAYLDFDPTRDGQYELITAGAADLVIRGVGDEATAIRSLPVERVSVTK